jgi:hypothetical protein
MNASSVRGYAFEHEGVGYLPQGGSIPLPVLGHNLAEDAQEMAAFTAGRPSVLYMEQGPWDRWRHYVRGQSNVPDMFVCTWIGTPALLVTSYREWTGSSFGGRYTRCAIQGRDLLGRRWVGVGQGRGMICRMRLSA